MLRLLKEFLQPVAKMLMAAGRISYILYLNLLKFALSNIAAKRNNKSKDNMHKNSPVRSSLVEIKSHDLRGQRTMSRKATVGQRSTATSR